jgi:hypothetical protein
MENLVHSESVHKILRKSFMILALISFFHSQAFSADMMTTASRIEGAAPLSIFFDAVDSVKHSTNSSVIQPRGFSMQPINCTGVKITRINISNDAGIGNLSYIQGSTSLTWQAPYDTAGNSINISGGGNFVLESFNGQAKLSVWVDPSILPGSDANDSISVAEGGENADWNSFNYRWSFGDIDSGSWDKGATLSNDTYPSKNSAQGFIAAHVYEQPGTYIAKLIVIDDEGNNREYEQTITVTAEPPGGWTTYHFSSEGNDDFGTGSPDNPFQSLDKARTLVADRVKLLFRKGDSFISNSIWVPSATTFCMEAYGTGDKPKFIINGNFEFLNGKNLSDARFINLGIIGNVADNVSHRGMYAIMHMGESALILRTYAENTGNSYNITDSKFTVLQESESSGHIMAAWISAPQTAVLGCRITDNRTFTGDVEAPLRAYAEKLVISHSHFERPATKNTIRFMRSQNVDGSDNDTGKWYIASYNKMVDIGINPMQSDSDTLMVKHVLLESNDFNFATPGRLAISMNGGDWATIRNNRLTTSNSTSFISFTHGYNAYDFHYSNIYIYNNVVYSSSTDYARFMSDDYTVAGQSTHFIIKNNIFFAPNVTSTINTFFIRLRDTYAPGSYLKSDNNCFYAPGVTNLFYDASGSMEPLAWQALGQDRNSITDNPGLSDPSNGNLTLQASSPCVDTGAEDALPWTRVDYDGNSRPVDGDSSNTAEIDMGAYEFNYNDIIISCDFDSDGDTDGSDLAQFSHYFSNGDLAGDVYPVGNPDEILDEKDVMYFSTKYAK